MKTLLVVILVLAIGILSYTIKSFEFFLIALIALALLFLVVTGVIHIFSKLNFLYFQIPFLIIAFCFFGVVVSLFRPYEAAIITNGNTSDQLKYAYQTDQSDRKQLKSFVSIFSKLKKRDTQRLNFVKELYAQGKIKKPTQKFYAAFIYHHSNNSEDYKRASELAAEAAKAKELADNYQAQWLKKAAYDRWMVSIGKPEKYNTQNSFNIEIE